MIDDDKLGDWVVSDITGDLNEVPCVGPVIIGLLGKPAEGGDPDDVVQSTHQLIGKFLSFKTTDIDAKSHCDCSRTEGCRAGQHADYSWYR